MGRPKERQEANAFVVEGVRLIEEAVVSGWKFQFALYTDGLSERGKDLINILIAHRIDIEEVSGDLLQKASETETPQGILAVLEFANIQDKADLLHGVSIAFVRLLEDFVTQQLIIKQLVVGKVS